MARHIGLPEAIQVEETLGQAFGGCHVGTLTAVGEGVAAAQTQPVAEVLVQLRVCRQTGLLPAERTVGMGSEVGERAERKKETGHYMERKGKMEMMETHQEEVD